MFLSKGEKELHDIKSRLDAGANISEEDGEKISRKLMLEAAGEFTKARDDFFSNFENIDQIIKMGYKFRGNDKIVFQVITALGFSVQSYGQASSVGIFDYMIGHLNNKNKKVKMAIARFLPSMIQFDEYEEKWEYIISIPQIPPKMDSRVYFCHALHKRYDQIPEQIKNRVIENLQAYLSKQKLDIDTAKRISDLISAICNS
jgi:hypothetical protein